LYRVATNAALDRLGRERRRRCALDGEEHRLRPEPEPAPDALLAGLDERTRERIRERVAGLPRKQREAVWLRWAEGFDYPAIAERLECSRESARANVYNGMKKLRAELADLWKEEYAT
jgi:RNA polymerase sigma-70 factor (ECF subfamily)